MTAIRRLSKGAITRYAYREDAERRFVIAISVQHSVPTGAGATHAIRMCVSSVNPSTERLVAYGRQCRSPQLFLQAFS